MKAASTARPWPLDERLLHVDPQRSRVRDLHVRDLPGLLAPGDVLIANDAATLPASLHTADRTLELRLLQPPHGDGRARALLFGAGDFRTPTERRAAPPVLAPGDELAFGPGLRAVVIDVDPDSPRWIALRFDRDGAELYQALYRHGRPIQYSYVPEPLALGALQTGFAARPWAVEMPSAGRPLTFGLLRALRERGVALHTLTHAAGLSSTGSDALDRRLPLPERYAIPAETVQAIEAARDRGGRVVAVGTTVVRALESSAAEHGGEAQAGERDATLIIGPGFVPRVVDGLFTGMHPPGTSHFALLTAFAPRELLTRALDHAAEHGYLEHELGDSCLVLAERSADRGR